MERDSDRMRVWDAKADAVINSIDSALGDSRARPPVADTSAQLDALTRRVMLRTPPPEGEILRPDPPPNMGPQPYRLDHWDAYVCRFDADEAAGA